jgi:hypothetical protein
MADLLLDGHPDAACGTEVVPLLRMQQIAAALAAITLADLIRGFTGGALGHGKPPEEIAILVQVLDRNKVPRGKRTVSTLGAWFHET